MRSCRKGVPATTSTINAGTSTNHGRRMTQIAIACHAPVPAGRRDPNHGMIRFTHRGHQSTRLPRTASDAGRKVNP